MDQALTLQLMDCEELWGAQGVSGRGAQAPRSSAFKQTGLEASQHFSNGIAMPVTPESSFPIPGPYLLPSPWLPPAYHYLEAFILKPAQGPGDPFFFFSPRICPQGLESLPPHMALWTPIWPGSSA